MDAPLASLQQSVSIEVVPMPARRALLCTIALVLLVGVGASPVLAQASLTRARELYQSADYEQSLAMLDQLRGNGAEELTEIGTYKAFCLLALGRNDDAARAIGAIVAVDPFYQPPESLASPRVRAVFREARQKSLPAIIQRDYAAAKAAFDRKDPNTTALFDRVLRLLGDPDATGPAAADLRLLAEGFRDLSRAFSAPPVVRSSPSQGEGPLTIGRGSEGAPQPAAAPAPQPTRGAQSPGATGAAPPIVSTKPGTEEDPSVTPPVALSQTLPRWNPPAVASLNRSRVLEGVLQVFIDDKGSVTDARIQSSILPQYDTELVKVARTWKFKPAMRNGQPVAYVKVMQIRLTPPAR
jgi:TonB family protein